MTSFLLFLWWVLQTYLFIMIARVIFDLVMIMARDWRPEGPFLVLANVVYGMTDPPLNFLRRYIPPLRLGAIALDMGFLIMFIGISVIQRILVTMM